MSGRNRIVGALSGQLETVREVWLRVLWSPPDLVIRGGSFRKKTVTDDVGVGLCTLGKSDRPPAWRGEEWLPPACRGDGERRVRSEYVAEAATGDVRRGCPMWTGLSTGMSADVAVGVVV